MINKTIKIWLIIMLIPFLISRSAQADLGTEVVRQGEYQIYVSTEKLSNYSGRHLLGTHSLWWGVQNDLIEPITNDFYPVVKEFFKTTNGVIRYGGGANEVLWSSCNGPAIFREKVKVVTWYPPMSCQFGIPEYISLLDNIENTDAWALANIAGLYDKNTDDEPLLMSEYKMVENIRGSAEGMKALAPSLSRTWELGNELWAGSFKLSPEKLAERASLAAKNIKEVDPSAKLILPVVEFDVPGQPKKKVFNQRLLESMTESVNGVAIHLYYDGAPGGPSIPTQINTVVEAASQYQEIKGENAEVWITEHGRWPVGDGSDDDWISNWYQTNDIGGVLGTADFLIALAQVKDVAGAMVHGLRAGPWNVFDKSEQGPVLTGIGTLFTHLSEAKNDTRVKTETTSENQSGYKGGYDLRATAFVNADNSIIKLWVVNRSFSSSKTHISMPLSCDDKIAKFSKGSSLICPLDSSGRCSGSQFKSVSVRPDQVIKENNNRYINIPARSVTTLEFKYN